jgi:hypothetical protein
MGDFHDTEHRPNKLKGISCAIVAGIDHSDGSLCDRGIVYYTLGGLRFRDIKLFYNVFGNRIEAAYSFEDDPKVLPKARKAAKQLRASGQIGKIPLEVLSGDIFDSDLKVVSREGRTVVLFLDTYEFLTLDHQGPFERWIIAHSLQAGDLVFVTTSLPPWEFLRTEFQAGVGPVLRNYGVTQQQMEDKEYLKEHYIRLLLRYFSEKWQHYRLSSRGFRHFYGQIYRDTRIPMALNGFIIT